jgi:hypothetical protein
MTSEVMAGITPPGHAPARETAVMQRLRPFLILVAVLFTAYSTMVVVDHGYTGFISLALREAWGMQMLLDLCISLTMVSSLLVIDARRRKRAAWPWVVITALLGSVGPLWYLVLQGPTEPK